MCTAISFNSNAHYFGRTLDLEYSNKEQIIITPREFEIEFKHSNGSNKHYAIMGVGIVSNNYPLYYEAINECGLCIAGLNFPTSGKYFNSVSNKTNVASYELIPWVLSQCKNVDEAEECFSNVNITNDSFNEKYKSTSLHWIISDKSKNITVEQTVNGLNIYNNDVGVLTNEPPFPFHTANLSNYNNLSVYEPNNKTITTNYGRGFGGVGLPGDLSSPSRFIRAVFTKENSIIGKDENESVSQFFHILGSVSQTKGSVRTESEQLERTVYTTCYNADLSIMYYTTYDNPRISAIKLFHTDVNGNNLICYNMVNKTDILYQN